MAEATAARPGAAQVGGDPEGLTGGGDTDRDHDDVDAVAELPDAEREAGLAVDRVEPDQADGQTDGEAVAGAERESGADGQVTDDISAAQHDTEP